AQKGALLTGEDDIPLEAEAYRRLLREILGDIDQGTHDHPKLRTVIREALDAADCGEKTLIFCSRIATLEQLRREFDALWADRILERWRRVYPGAAADQIFDTVEGDDTRQRGRHSLLQARCHRPQDAAYLVLRECCCRTVLPAAGWALERLPD